MTPAPGDQPRWPVGIVAMHWLTAALVAVQYGIARLMTDDARDLIARFTLYQWHKSIGLTVACLAALRLLHRLITRPPPAIPLPAWQRRAAQAVQAALYLCLIAIPVTGFLMVCAAPIQIPTLFFGLFAVPHPIGPDKMLYDAMLLWHERLFDVLAVLTGLHAGAALLHHYVLKDGLTHRMGFARRPQP